MKIAILAAIMALTGCASSKLVTLPDGAQGYVIKGCHDMAKCYEKARAVCGGNYEILDKGSGTVGTVSGAGGYVSGATSTQYTITIRCKGGSTP